MNLCVPVKTDIIPEVDSSAIFDTSAGISDLARNSVSILQSYRFRVRWDTHGRANATKNHLKPLLLNYRLGQHIDVLLTKEDQYVV